MQSDCGTVKKSSQSSIKLYAVCTPWETKQPSSVQFPPVPSLHLCLFSLLSHSCIYSEPSPGHPWAHSSLSASLSPPALIRGPRSPSSHLVSGNGRWDCFSAVEERQGRGEFDDPQPCKLDCQNFTVVSISLWIKANTTASPFHKSAYEIAESTRETAS